MPASVKAQRALTDILKPQVFDINDEAWLNPHKAAGIHQFCP